MYVQTPMCSHVAQTFVSVYHALTERHTLVVFKYGIEGRRHDSVAERTSTGAGLEAQPAKKKKKNQIRY